MRDFVEWVKSLFSGQVTEPKEKPLIETLKEKGYHWDEELESWVRVWTTNNDTEKVLEVYKQFNGDNNVNGWKVSMIGNDGNVFYEEDYKGGVA